MVSTPCQSQGALINQKSDTQKLVLIIIRAIITYIIVTAKSRDLSTFTFCHNGATSLSLLSHLWPLSCCPVSTAMYVQLNLLKCTVSERFAVQTFLHCSILHLLRVWKCPCSTLHSSALCVALWGCESVSPVRLLGSLCHYQTSTQHPTSHLHLYHLFGFGWYPPKNSK